MKNIIYQGLAVSFIGMVLLACASPIALNATSLLERSSLASLPDSIRIHPRGIAERAFNTELTNRDGLTRRALTVPTPSSKLEYTTPRAFIDSLDAYHTRARRHQIELWQKNGVKDLEDKVDSLTASGIPTWLVLECRDQIGTADQQISTFVWEEFVDTSPYDAIKIYQRNIRRVSGKLQKITPGPPYVDKGQDVNRHAEARRKRIGEWGKGNQVTALKGQVESLPRFGFPNWLVSACLEEISHTLKLVVKFKEEEKEKDSLDTITKHETAIRQVQRDLTESWDRDFNERVKQLLSKIREGGAWRKLIKELVDAAMEDPHMNSQSQEDLQDHTKLYIHAGFRMIAMIMQKEPGQEVKVEMNRFRGFLRRQWHRRGNGRPDSDRSST